MAKEDATGKVIHSGVSDWVTDCGSENNIGSGALMVVGLLVSLILLVALNVVLAWPTN